MSREIKFRAWVLKEEKMVQHRNRAPAVKMFTPDYAYTNKEVIVMEYTGLKDKNGTEVCEGDVFFDSRREEYGKVVLSEGAFCVEWSMYTELAYEVAADHFTEIIGNIYEHPHLVSSKSTL